MTTPCAPRTLDAPTVQKVVEAAVLAPSILNCQPWRFRATDDRIDVHVVPERAPQVLDSAGRELHLSVGAAVFNLRLALAAAGLQGVVELVPSALDPTLVATVRVSGDAMLDETEQALFEAIPRRRSSKEPFTGAVVEYLDFDLLQEAAAIEGAHLEVATGLHRTVIDTLLHDADRMLRDSAPDTVPDRTPAENAERTLVAILLSSGDAPADWVRAGMALERVLLEATVRGLQVGLLSQATEVPDLRRLVRDPMSAWRHPQILVRVGHGDPPPSKPRLPLADVLEIC